MVKLWCEYDYGQDGVVFTSYSKAEAWLRNAIAQDDGDDIDYDDMFENGLISFEKLEVI